MPLCGGPFFLLLGFPAFLVEAEAGGFMVAAAELADFVGHVHDEPAFVGVVDALGDGGLEAASEGDRHERGKPIGGGGDIDYVGEVAGLLAHLFEPIAGFLEAKPILEAALFPFGEVLFGDRAAFEFLVEDALNVGEGIEPFDELDSCFAVLEAKVEVFTQGVRETGDFSGPSHKMKL
jgi:hypothetical protein